MSNLAHRSGSWAKRSWRIPTLLLAILSTSLLAELIVSLVAPQDLSGTFRLRDERGLTLHEKSLVFKVPGGPEYAFDERGLRVDPARIVKQPVVRVLVLGDSFTFGWRLDVEDTFVSHLQRLADSTFGRGRIELANGGHPGWGAADYVSFVEHYGEALSPDGILVFLNAFDIDRSVAGGRFQLVHGGEGDIEESSLGDVRSRVRDVGRRVPGYQWLLTHSHLVQLARRAAFHSRSVALEPAANGASGHQALARALFRRLAALCTSRDYAIQILTTGFLEVEIPEMEARSREASLFFAHAPEFFAAEGIAYFDIGPSLAATVRSDFQRVILSADDPHPNAYGSELIATLSWPVVEPWLNTLAKARP